MAAVTKAVPFDGACLGSRIGCAPQLARVTMEVLPELFGDTFVFCGHEYTAANAEFAAWVEPENEAIQKLVRRPVSIPAAGCTCGSPLLPCS